MELIYQLPDEKVKVAEIVSLIPEAWSWIDGKLLATRELYEQDAVAMNTQLFLSRSYLIKPTIRGSLDAPYEEQQSFTETFIEPRIIDVLLRGKLFSSIDFDTAGFEKSLPMHTVREIAREFILKGYKGQIGAYSGHQNNNQYDNPERLHISHYERKITLQWKREFLGSRKNLDDIIQGFRVLHFKRLQPRETE
ncbi:hypothetical protein HY642_06750 [Candidatus Woesearchaeota archaeon]|nr:hypothetical protein [Candidatus Woesearchaeota archaeon]